MPMTTKELYWYWLASCPGVGIGSIFAAANAGFSLEQLFSEPQLLAQKPFRFSEQTRKLLRQRADIALLLEEVERIERQGIRIYTAISAGYPQLLKDLWRPPAILYAVGQLQKFPKKSIAMVGSRYVSRKGAAAAREVAGALAGHGVTVVSGMARGIDTQCHWGALDAQGQTIAVLGCGVDIIYPQENAELYAQICERGAVVSEYPPGMTPNPRHFPLRNRIIAGLSQGVVLGEAGLRSGANITVNYACDANRDVFVIDKRDGSGNGETIHKLVSMGATPIREATEIIEYYDWNRKQSVATKQKETLKPPPGLDFFQGELYNLLLKGDFSMQQMVDLLGQPAAAVSTALTMLELKGIVERLPGNVFGLRVERH